LGTWTNEDHEVRNRGFLVTFVMIIGNDNLQELQFKQHRLAYYYGFTMKSGDVINLFQLFIR
jgi:hypothetical protein